MRATISSMGPVIESDGFRHFSITPPDRHAIPITESRVLHRASDGLTLTSYESFAEGVSFTQPAAAMWETFYIVEGTVTCAPAGSEPVTFRTGDLVYRSWEQDCELAYSDGLRVLRFIWSAQPLPEQAGGSTRGPLPVPPGAAPSTETQGLNHLHVFGNQGPRTEYHEQPVMNRPVDVSADGRHISFYGVLPEGVSFTEYPANVGETFYLVKGNIRCTPRGGGKTIEWKAGDLVYWPYDREFDLEYSAGMGCICWFWSDEPLPDFTGGVIEAVGGSQKTAGSGRSRLP